MFTKHDFKPLGFFSKFFHTCYREEDLEKLLYSLAEVTKERDHFILKKKENEELINKLKTDMELLREEDATNISKLQDRIDTSIKENEVFKSKIDSLTEDIKHIEKECDVRAQKLKSTHRTEVNKLTKECGDKIIKADKESEKLKNKIAKLEEELKAVKIERDQYSNDVKDLTSKLDQIDKEVSDVVNAIGKKKFSCEQVREWRQRKQTGEKVSQIAREYGIASSTVARAIKCETYRECCEDDAL